MKPTLAAGLSDSHSYMVTAENTVPHLAMDRSTFDDIPEVLATAYMVVMMEGACTKVLGPRLDVNEGSLGIAISVTHLAATVPGQTVTVTATIERVEGRKVPFHVVAHAGLDKIGEGTRRRAIVPWDRFKAGVDAKARRAAAGGSIRHV